MSSTSQPFYKISLFKRFKDINKGPKLYDQHGIFFQSNDLNYHEVIKTLQECFILIGESIVQLPKMELTWKAQEKRFEDIYKVPFENKNECQKYVMTLPQFEIQFLTP